MDKYYAFPQKRKSFLTRVKNKCFPEKKVKPITQPIVKSNDEYSAYFYEKYGIVYTGSIEGSCINALMY